jgi:hypothetical protein
LIVLFWLATSIQAKAEKFKPKAILLFGLPRQLKCPEPFGEWLAGSSDSAQFIWRQK